MSNNRRIRVLMAKPGLDGHDRGAQVVSMALRDAGMEVVYTGLHQSIPDIIEAAIQEDVDVIGLSVLSGTHVPLVRKLMTGLEEANVADKIVVVGGTIPPDDVPTLRKLGVEAVFAVGTPLSHIPEGIRALVESHSEQRASRGHHD